CGGCPATPPAAGRSPRWSSPVIIKVENEPLPGGQSRHLLPHAALLRRLPGEAVQLLWVRPAGAPPVLQLVPALVAGGDDEPGLLPLRVLEGGAPLQALAEDGLGGVLRVRDRKSTRLNSSHVSISYAVFCLKKKN